MDGQRDSVVDEVQSSQYRFPYHYLPTVNGFPNFSKFWGFSASYIAAINLFVIWLKNEKAAGATHLHMDYGCGDGGFIYHVKELNTFDNVDFWGIDFDENAINWAKQFSQSETFICGDLANLPSLKYDSGSLIEVYEHIPPKECRNFLANIANSLKKDASLFVTVPSTEKKVSAKHYRHFDFETLLNEFDEYFIVEDIFGFERKNFFSKIIMRVFYSRWWTIETIATNRLLINSLQSKHSHLKGCGRIGLILRRK
ncbi:MAG: class I SAM-dependent methyltransferase [Candidatus Puniceispirillaceae bacterium]